MNATTDGIRRIIGIDLGDKYSHYCELNGAGEIMEEGRVPTTATAFRRRFGPGDPARIAIETGGQSTWVARVLATAGHDVLVANARKLRVIYTNDRKSDQVDAQSLARIARLDPQLLAPVSQRTVETQRDLALLRSRQALVRARTQLVNHVRGTVKAFGARLPSCSTAAFHRQTLDAMPAELRPVLEPILRLLGQLTEEIKDYDHCVSVTARSTYPDTERLMQIPGIGPVTALTYRLTIEDPHRFANSRAVGSYLGLRPRQRASGAQNRQLRITKAGDSDLRRLLVGSAQYILGPFGPDCDLRRWGTAIAARGGKNAKKRAIVAVARKLAVLLHRLWVSGENYRPQRAPEELKIAEVG